MLVLLDEQPSRQLVLLFALDETRVALEILAGEANRNLRVAAEVLHPVRAVAVAGEHVEGVVLDGEPDLDLVRPAAHPPDGSKVAEVLVCEAPGVGRHLALAGRLGLLALPQLDAPDLAARGLGELFYELDLARVLVRGGLALAVVLYLPDQVLAWLVVGGEDHERLDQVPPLFVGHSHYGALGDRRVAYEDVLDLERPYTVSGGENHVVRAPHEPEVAGLVPGRSVAGEVVAVLHNGLGLVGLLPVLFEERGVLSGERNVARLTRRAFVAFRVEYSDVAAGGGFTHRAGPDLHTGEVSDEQGVLRLAVAIVDREPVQLLPPFHDRRIQGFPGRGRVPDGGEVGAFELGGVGEDQILGWGQAEDRDPILPYELQALHRVEGRL